MQDPRPQGRRERKKAQTRDALREAAGRLFAEQGFAATTVQQIADAADVSERTFFRYFASKEDLLLPVIAALFAEAEQTIRDRPLDEPPLVSILEGLVQAAGRRAGEGGMAIVGRGFDPTDPIVAGRFVKAYIDWEDRLAGILAERFRTIGTDLDAAAARFRAAVTADAAVSALRATLRALREAPTAAHPTLADVAPALREAFAVLGAGCPNPATTVAAAAAARKEAEG